MKLTTHFMHQSQGTWLLEDTPYIENCKWHAGLSPLSMLFSKGLLLHLNWWHSLTPQFKTICFDFQAEPVLMHSPLLKESLWVSHPPPIYMLKFSGFAGLNSWFENECKRRIIEMTSLPQATYMQDSIYPRLDAGDERSSYALHVSKACQLWHIKHAQTT